MLRTLGIKARILVLAVPIAVATVAGVVVLGLTAGDSLGPGLVAGAIGAIGIVATIVLASIVAATITRPLEELSEAAEGVAASLPTVLERVRGGEDIEFEALAVQQDDELGRLTSAVNELSQTSLDVAASRAGLEGTDVRTQIAGLFVNVVRRDHTLLKRMLSQLDELERSEEDPDTLHALFKLDHLATRMRRNAESLLVLAGRESSRRRRQPMPLTDVVRSASSEIEHYERVDLAQHVDPSMLGHAALPIAHLLAELLENATRYSDPGSRVMVETSDGPKGIRVTITDNGLGMSEGALAKFNDRIANPPLGDVIAAEKLGFYVVGRLASKLEASVTLAKGGSRGTVVTVDLAPALFVPGSLDPPGDADREGDASWHAEPEVPDMSSGAPSGEPAVELDKPAADVAASAEAPAVSVRRPAALAPDLRAAVDAFASLEAEEMITPQIVPAPSRPGGLPGRTGALPARGAKEASPNAASSLDAPAVDVPVAEVPGMPAFVSTAPEAEVPAGQAAAFVAGPAAEAPTLPGRGLPRVPSPRTGTGSAPAPFAPPTPPSPITAARPIITGAGALDIVPTGRGGRRRKQERGQASPPSVSAIAAAAQVPDEAYVPQAIVPNEPIGAPEEAADAGSLSDALRARSAMASRALSELSQLSGAGGAPLVRRERGATDAGKLAASSAARAEVPAAPSRPTRSAADVRSMLSGFQAGVNRGRDTDADAAKPSGPGT